MINKQRLQEEQKRFRQLTEWSFVPSGIEEDNDNDTTQSQNTDDMGGMNMDNNQDINTDSNGVDMSGGMQDQGMNQDPNQDINMAQPDNSSMENMNDIPPLDDDTKEQQDDEVIDVTKLTDAQIKMNDKLKSFINNMGTVNSSITDLMNLVDSLDKKIDNSNSQIQDLKQTIKDRLPNEEEKIQQRAEDGYPFSNNPSDIDSVHAKDPDTKKNITAGDIANYNHREIEQSFNDIDDLRQDINKIFNF